MATRSTPNPAHRQDLGRLLLRLTIGGLVLLHGIAKLKSGIGGIEGMAAKAGLPGVVAYGVYVGEVLAPLAVIVGAWTRPAALVVAFNMVVALALVHAGDLGRLTAQGGWAVELQMCYLLGAVAIALLGAGRYAVAAGRRWS